MKVVVTGGAGFLGSHVVDALIARGDDVIVFDHHVKDKKRWPNRQAKVYKMRFGDPRVEKLLKKEKPDAVVHLAAQISVTKSIANPLEDAEHNLFDSIKFTQWSQQAGVKKFVFASSGGAIYGDHPKRPTPLLHDAQPLSPYGVAKLAFEQYLEHFWQLNGLSFVSLRFANLFGPRQQVVGPKREGGAIPQFLDRLLVTGEPIVTFGDGSPSRDYVYIDDAVEAVLRALDKDVTGVVNIGTGKGTSLSQLLKKLLALHGDEHPIEHRPFRSGEVKHSVLDASSAKKLLGWKPRVSFDEGLRRTYEWYREHFGTTHMRRIGPSQLDEAVRVLKDGGVIVFPTETSYGIGCDATNDAAVRRIIDIKGRSPKKGMPVILPPEADPSEYVIMCESALALAKRHWPGPLNIAAKRNPTSPIAQICERNGDQSVRKSSHPIAQELARRLGKPIVATSANPSGADAAYMAAQVPRFFGSKNAPDVFIDYGNLPVNKASTTVRCEGESLQVLRQGGIVVSL